MRTELKLGLVVFGMLIACGLIIIFSMQGGESGTVPVDNPSAPATTAGDTQPENASPTIPPNRVANTASDTPRLPRPDTTPDLSGIRPSARPSTTRDTGTSPSPTRITSDTGTESTPDTGTTSPRASRTSPDMAVLTPDNATDRSSADNDTSTTERTLPPTRTTLSEERAAASPIIPERTTTPEETTEPTTSGQEIEELIPVESRQPRVVNNPEPREERLAPTPAPPTSGGRVHTVATGERLWDLAAEAYGDGKYWGIIARANPDIDPDRLLVGQRLNIPPRSTIGTPPTRTETTTSPSTGAPSRPAETARATYTVERGDSLVKIADTLYGDKYKWRAIYELNRDVLNRPELIRPGMKLKLPPLPD